ncbi:MAG TPA: peptidylprolyl isomerase [Edaphocola sp.]|nr:peptidylprolyl isomerase [Edaphocola sp.]
MVRKTLYTSILLGIALSSFAQEKQYADKIVAKVGNKIILQSDIGRQYLGAQKDQSIAMPESTKCQMLKDAIDSKIMYEQAARDSVMVTPEEVDNAVEQQILSILYQNFNGDKAAMEQGLGKSIYQIKEEYREVFKERYTVNRMMEEVVKNVVITPKEVEIFFKNIPEEEKTNIPATVEIGQVVWIPEVDKEVEQYAKTKTEDIRKQIVEEGKSFATMAQIYSEDAGAQNGGEMMLNRKNPNIDSRFVAAAFKLQPGEVSPVFRSSFGYHIIKMLERNGDDAKIQYIVIIPKATSSDFEKAKVKLDSVRNLLITSKLSFNDAVSKFSNDDMSKQSGGMVRDEQTGASVISIENITDPNLALEVSNLNVGEYSQPATFTDPMDHNTKMRFIYIKSKTPPHQLNLKDDYSIIQNYALQKKKMEHLTNWLQEKKSGYYIKIDPNYTQSCDILKSYTIN